MINTKPQGAGSIWNPNSWHWEEKDYTKIAQKVIEDKINSLKFEKDGITFVNTCKTVKGDAQVNIRKGKQILNYDFDVDVEWKADSDSDDAVGTYKLKDLNSMDIDFEIIGLQASAKTPISDQSKELIRKNLFPLIKAMFKTLLQELAQYESNPEKLKIDEEKRKQAADETQKAKEQSGEEKERIFQEQKKKDQDMKEQYSQWNQQKTSQQQGQVESQQQ